MCNKTVIGRDVTKDYSSFWNICSFLMLTIARHSKSIKIIWMLSLSILLPVLHTHAAQPSHCRLSDRQNSEGQQVNNETLACKKAGPGPSVMLSSTRCSVRCLFIVVLVGLLRLFCQIAYDGSSPVCTATTLSHCRPNTARYTVAKQYTVYCWQWRWNILQWRFWSIFFRSQALNEIWPFFSRFFGAEFPLLFLRIKVKSLSCSLQWTWLNYCAQR